MERTEFEVHGEAVHTLPRAIGGYPRGKRVQYDGDGFSVVVTEQYFFRTNSTLQATTIFELTDETTCEVAISPAAAGLVSCSGTSAPSPARQSGSSGRSSTTARRTGSRSNGDGVDGGYGTSRSV